MGTAVPHPPTTSPATRISLPPQFHCSVTLPGRCKAACCSCVAAKSTASDDGFTPADAVAACALGK